MWKFEPIARLNNRLQRDETRIYILEVKIDIGVSQTINGQNVEAKPDIMD